MNEMVLVSADLRFELDGVLADMDVGREFGAVCRATIVRVRDALTPVASNAEAHTRGQPETASPVLSAPPPIAAIVFHLANGKQEAVLQRHTPHHTKLFTESALTAESRRANNAETAASQLAKMMAIEIAKREVIITAERERAEKAEAALNVAVALADQRYSLLKGFQAEVERLREDERRLDWLDKAGWEEGHGFCCVHYGTYRHYVHAQSYDGRERSARAVIDTARKEEKS